MNCSNPMLFAQILIAFDGYFFARLLISIFCWLQWQLSQKQKNCDIRSKINSILTCQFLCVCKFLLLLLLDDTYLPAHAHITRNKNGNFSINISNATRTRANEWYDEMNLNRLRSTNQQNILLVLWVLDAVFGWKLVMF